MARQMYLIELPDSYYASSATVPIMNMGFTFTKGIDDPAHPECRRKELMLDELEAASLSDRFTVKAIETVAESKTEKAARVKAAAAAANKGEGE